MDLIFAKQYEKALTVKCETCDAEPNQPCINSGTGRPLEHQPAHYARLRASGAGGAVGAGRQVAR